MLFFSCVGKIASRYLREAPSVMRITEIVRLYNGPMSFVTCIVFFTYRGFKNDVLNSIQYNIIVSCEKGVCTIY